MLKTILATAVAAVVSFAVNEPARAGVCYSCGYWNGTSTNGLALNGGVWNGIKKNGLRSNGSETNSRSWQGRSYQGISLNGADAATSTFTIFAIELPAQAD
jgi:hypothetical protein